jgi:hypothetical protein
MSIGMSGQLRDGALRHLNDSLGSGRAPALVEKFFGHDGPRSGRASVATLR